MKVQDIRQLFINKFLDEDFEIDKTGVKTIDLTGVQFEADEDFIFGTPNEDYQNRELEWYLSQSLNVHDIPGKTPKIWLDVADPSGFINSNYGWMVFSKENGNQYENCINELKQNANSRRASIIYIRPSIWKEYNKNGMSDFICTYATQLFIRKNTLEYIVYMRSNDAWAGYRNDKFWHDYVMNKAAKELNIQKTRMIWNAGSLHMYERNFKLIEEYILNKS